jgi:hypothetical protein
MSDVVELGSLEDRVLVGPEVIQEMEEQMQSIRQRIKEAQDRQKSYVDVHRIDHSVTSHSTDHTYIDLFFEDTCVQVIQLWYIMISFRL